MSESHRLKYVAINPEDRKWGMVVNVAGYQEKEADTPHPAGLHPGSYMFTKDKGRILPCFQILYITRGHGEFHCGTLGRDNPVRIKEGDMFLLFPGEWHTYYADPGSIWGEFWIGFEGKIPQEWLSAGLLDKSHPVFHVGLREDVSAAYSRAIEVMIAQKPGYQQLLGSLAANIVSLALYYDKSGEYEDSADEEDIKKARILVEQQLATITPEELALKVNMGYSKFRKLFRSYTGFAPAQYISEMKISRAKELLSGTDNSIKAIASDLGFRSGDYFVTAFKRHTGMRPLAFRKQSRTNNI